MFEVLQTYFSPSTRIGGPATRKSRDGVVVTPPKPYLTWLLAFFVAWKLLLLGIAYASPGPGYDTSTRILFHHYDVQAHSWISRVVERITLRLTRWDALYFSTSSERGHSYEQEWAFSWFMARFMAILSNGAWPYFAFVATHRLSIIFSVSIFPPYLTHCQTCTQRHPHLPSLSSGSSAFALFSSAPHDPR
jgi:hypothetical protein